MAKRKINKQQKRRISQQQHRRVQRAQSESAENTETASLGPEQSGLVIERFGRQVEIETGDGELIRCHIRANLDSVVTGDRIIWQQGEDLGVVVAIEPRHSLLTRPDFNRLPKPVAANIDQMLIVIASQPPPFGNLIDRYLVAAEAHNLHAILLRNKADLKTNSETDALLERYEKLGYSVLSVSSKSGEGLESLKEKLRNATSIFVGQSGVGKSSLVNALMPGTDTLVGELSHAADKGRHTTTTARLFHFPDGGDLIDSPGIREFGMQNVDRASVDRGFREFQPLIEQCRFRNCRHESEPGCALIAAWEAGEISDARLQSYRQIIAELGG